uniref:Uncharacterized protein n=1 Tax=Arundo donax TaxID=35708 RepID=A0A0A9AXJ1_ARUDO
MSGSVGSDPNWFRERWNHLRRSLCFLQGMCVLLQV